MTGFITIIWLGAATCIAVAVACVAIQRARAARRAGDQKHVEIVELARTVDADSRLADDVAHGLNDLLTAMTGHAELLIASLDPSGTSIRDAYAIRDAALSATRLTRPLRALSGGHRAPADVIDVNAVTARTVASLEPMLGPKIDVTLALDHGIKRTKVGPGHLEEIVLNLCLHARDAMPNGGQLTVATRMLTRDGRDAAGGPRGEYVRVVVSDTGGGMSPAAQARRFEPFAAGEGPSGNTTGLANVDAIVKQAGGWIQVDSASGAGTTCLIDLPATSEPVTAIDRAPTRTHPPVLVVEDEPGMREFIRLVLVRAGHEVVTAAGPRAALEALNRQPAISLMLVDVVMPGMDGYEVVAEARKISPGVHVVFMSAFAPDSTRQPGGDGFLAKPFTSEVLAGMVEKTLSC